MRSFFALTSLLFYLVSSLGCTTYHADYLIYVSEVEPAPKGFTKQEPAVATEFKDEIAVWVLGPVIGGSLDLQVTNNSSLPLKIIWDETTIIDEFGITHRTLHVGPHIFDSEKAVVPTLVPPHSTHSGDSVIPVEWVNWKGKIWRETHRFFDGPSRHVTCRRIPNPFFVECDTKKASLEEINKPMVGKSFKLFLTYEYDGRKIGRSITIMVGKIEISKGRGRLK